MTVEAKDLSNYDGAPIMLYDFYRTSTATLTKAVVETHWRYTSADRDFVLGDDTYSATAVSDDGIRQSGSSISDQLTITMPYTEHVPQMFVGSPPSDPILCVIRHANEGETDSFIAWVGIVGMVTRTAGSGDTASVQASIVCNTISATLDRTGLRLCWSRSCPHDLYGFECRADPRGFVVTGEITSMDGISIVVDETAGIGPLTDGPVTSATINEAGLTYAVGDTGFITTGDSNATYRVVTVNGSGSVTAFTRDADGTGYMPGVNVATTTTTPQPGVGLGLTFDITVSIVGGAPTFNGGFIEWTGEDGHADRLGVTGFDNATGRLTLLGLTDRLSVGTLVHCFLGCDRLRPTCQTVFDNEPNHGGHAYMPDLNPFNNDVVF